MSLVAPISLLTLLSIITHFPFPPTKAIDSTEIEHCPKRCGGHELEISYPFGIGQGCSLPGFEVICNSPFGNTPILADPNLPLVEINQTGQVRIDSSPKMAVSCFPRNPLETVEETMSLSRSGPFTIPIRANTVMVIGCGATGGIRDNMSENSCSSICHGGPSTDGSCNGTGCCGAPFPPVSKYLNMWITGYDNDSNPNKFSNCRYGFVVENGGYSFRKSDIEDFNSTSANISMRLEWAIGEGKCLEAMESPAYVCGSNSRCMESDRESGYLCRCLDGYRGNPYLNGSQGCQDIDECNDDQVSSPCVPKATCHNEVPFFKCVCPKGRGGSKCVKRFPTMQVIAGIIACLGGIILVVYWSFRAVHKIKLMKLREKYFAKNGGILLQQHLSSNSGFTKCSRIYSAEELKRATDNYSSKRILGCGGHGTVYKGIFKDGTIVAIKKSQSIAESQINQFINEIVILTQINHKNVVRLLGCCLEVEVPMLVYEFILNGSLYQKIHGNQNPHISWQTRSRIAIEIAEALSYLHSSTITPIFHRDVKSSNILLDENYSAKVADFGLSKLVPFEKSKLLTKVHGTFGYLDPEYFHTGKLTEKSDVYSFGVVLLELLTGRKPICPDSSLEFCGLATFFLSCVNLEVVLEARVAVEGKLEELQVVANIARRCLSEKSEERPTMKVVLQELLNSRVNLAQQLQQTKKEGRQESEDIKG